MVAPPTGGTTRVLTLKSVSPYWQSQSRTSTRLVLGCAQAISSLEGQGSSARRSPALFMGFLRCWASEGQGPSTVRSQIPLPLPASPGADKGRPNSASTDLSYPCLPSLCRSESGQRASPHIKRTYESPTVTYQLAKISVPTFTVFWWEGTTGNIYLIYA